MVNPNPRKQYDLFLKYWKKGSEEEDIAAFKLANDLRKKLVPVFREFLEDEAAEEDRHGLAECYAQFAEFLFEYFLLLQKSRQNPQNIHFEVKEMADLSLAFNPKNFVAAYYLAAHSSWNITKAHAGEGSAIYRGQGAADSIVGTAITLLGKGLTLGVTAAGAGFSKNTFNAHVKLMIENYQHVFAKQNPSVFAFIEYSQKMFVVAEYCEEKSNSIWREIYAAVVNVDIDALDFSDAKEEYIEQLTDEASEIQILAHAKV